MWTSLILTIVTPYIAATVTDENCLLAQNPLGNCSCAGQFFMSYDCSLGFTCRDETDDSDLEWQVISFQQLL